MTLELNVGTLMQGLTLALLVWFWNEFHAIKQRLTDFQRESKEWQARIETGLFGATGENGLHGTSKDHETRIRLLEQHNNL